MRKTIALLAGTLAVAALIGPAIAAETSSSKSPATEAPKSAPAKMTERHLTAQVVAVNADAKTLTVKRSPKAKPMTLTVDPAATSALTDLKAGDRVKIGYIDEHGQLTAKTISKDELAAKK
jgi:Cu/Ag efflux protein CusF